MNQLSPFERCIAAVLGLCLVGIGGVLFYHAPERIITESAGGHVLKQTITYAETATITAIGIAVGVALLIFAINGLKLSRFSAGGINVESHGPSNPEASESRAGSNEVEELKKQGQAEWERYIETFFQLSSWNGKKVLYACSLSSQTGKPLNLRGLCDEDKNLSFDYAYGYLVAASCAGFLAHTTADFGSTVSITTMHPLSVRFLLKHIEGHLPLPPEDKPNKILEIYKIAGRFGVSPPHFTQKP